MGFARVPVGLAWEATAVSSDTHGVEKKQPLRLSRTCPMAAVLGHRGFGTGAKWARDEMMLENTAVLLGSSRCDWGSHSSW